ncbi:MAG: hypothetical protein J0M26_18270 [Planctomycetes bacterium]|nr:hypothetical protein [Planctomycetota bacterium]
MRPCRICNAPIENSESLCSACTSAALATEARVFESLPSSQSPLPPAPSLPEEDEISFPTKVVLFLIGSMVRSVPFAGIGFLMAWRFAEMNLTSSVWIGISVITVWVAVDAVGTWIEQKVYSK